MKKEKRKETNRRDAFILLCIPAIIFGGYLVWIIFGKWGVIDDPKNIEWAIYRKTKCVDVTPADQAGEFQYLCEYTKTYKTSNADIAPTNWQPSPY